MFQGNAKNMLFVSQRTTTMNTDRLFKIYTFEANGKIMTRDCQWSCWAWVFSKKQG